ncbi:MAG TPA: hypothetical protein VIC51_13810 [Psychromonas sp.]
MSQDAQATVHIVTTQITILGGALTWASANTSLLTLFVFAATGLASIIYGNRNSRANERRNEINEDVIKAIIIKRLMDSGESEELINKVKEAVKN